MFQSRFQDSFQIKTSDLIAIGSLSLFQSRFQDSFQIKFEMKAPIKQAEEVSIPFPGFVSNQDGELYVNFGLPIVFQSRFQDSFQIKPRLYHLRHFSR